MRKNLVSLFFLMVSVAGFAQKPMLPRDADLENRVQKQLSKMTLDEKIGQMVELEIVNLPTTPPPLKSNTVFELPATSTMLFSRARMSISDFTLFP